MRLISISWIRQMWYTRFRYRTRTFRHGLLIITTGWYFNTRDHRCDFDSSHYHVTDTRRHDRWQILTPEYASSSCTVNFTGTNIFVITTASSASEPTPTFLIQHCTVNERKKFFYQTRHMVGVFRRRPRGLYCYTYYVRV